MASCLHVSTVWQHFQLYRGERTDEFPFETYGSNKGGSSGIGGVYDNRFARRGHDLSPDLTG